MSLQSKYQPVLNLGEALGAKDGFVQEENGVLKFGGVVATAYEKDQLWDKIKEIGGDSPSDVIADIRVENNDYYHRHTVAKGESLSLIAKKYYGDLMEYKKIYEANTNILDNPDRIDVGQELVIPF